MKKIRWRSTSITRVLVVMLAALPAGTRAGAADERCIVCGGPATGVGDEPIAYRGREVLVCGRAPCLEEWREDPERFFRAVQARGALYDEEAVGRAGLGPGWLIAGLYMLAGTVFGGVCAYVAVARGLRPLVWFLAGVVGNVVALALVATRRGDVSGLPAGVPPGLRKVPTTYAPGRCDACGAEHHPAATRCPRCGRTLEPSVEAEARRVS